MAFTVNSLMSGCDNTVYYTAEFRAVLEDHMEYLRNNTQTTTKTVSAGIAYRYEYDLFGMLTYYGVPHHLHWVIMRMMGMDNPNELRRTLTSIPLPSGSVLEEIRSAYTATA